jgi:hypothetical protein
VCQCPGLSALQRADGENRSEKSRRQPRCYNRGLLQQNLPQEAVSKCSKQRTYSITSRHAQRSRCIRRALFVPVRPQTASRYARPVLAGSACAAVGSMRSSAPPLATVLPPRLSSHGHRREIVAQWHVLRDVLFRDAPFDLVFSLLHPADIAIDDAGMVLLADELVALRMLE